MTTILDPTDERKPVERQITPRSGSLSGVIGLLDISKPRGNVFLDELEQLLAQKAPDVTVKRYMKPTFAKPCPDALRQQIRNECSFVIEALAD
ncbi:hypothetical protein SAMN04488523_104118 [Sulfitobacter brevis]|uniref:UGSC-like domain-containing protein n=3 Tax=Sulfitobacter brevis TaxID=74348 RepID=A0A1I1WSB1_9RHOB|nr:hypothetical protein SAMN04488523_104118 [Sulfitobacter brevis]